MRSHPMATGFILGLAATWAFHKFVRPLPGGGATGSLSGRS